MTFSFTRPVPVLVQPTGRGGIQTFTYQVPALAIVVDVKLINLGLLGAWLDSFLFTCTDIPLHLLGNYLLTDSWL